MAVELIGKQCNILGYRKYKEKNTEYRKINRPHSHIHSHTHTHTQKYLCMLLKSTEECKTWEVD